MNNVLIIIAVAILIICMYVCFSYSNDDKLEFYDLEIPDITVNECGTRCTEGLNCAGFAYKPIEAKCYLAKSPILGRPMESLYSESYSKLDRRCNKINRILDDKRIDGNTLTQASVYICSDGEMSTATEFQYANLGSSSLESARTTIFDRADKDKSTPVNVRYEVYDIEWPKEKPIVSDLTPKLGTDSKTDAQIKSGFIESDKEFLGQYLLAHQCVTNVPLFDCLKYCENNPKCVGTEWNRAIVRRSRSDGDFDYLYENVCCPKAVIKQTIPRRNEFDRGRFYVKKDLSELIDRDKVTIAKTKSDNSSKTRYDFEMTEFDKENRKIHGIDVNFVEWRLDSP